MSPFTVSKRVALLIVMLLCFFTSDGQTAADTLREVKVKGKRKRLLSNDERINTYAPGQKVTTIDSITLQQYQFQSVANLLSQQSPAFIKTYGINGLATLNFRGASAAQSQVFWNGVPLQNAALGISDVSLLPVSLMNKVHIVYGSSAAMWGSGNVGGALVVENEKPYFSDSMALHHAVYAVAGSFNQYQLGGRSVLSADRWYIAANGFYQSAHNNFSYTDNGAKKYMDNAALNSGVGLLQVVHKLDEENTIGITAWYQQYYREIPRALFEAQSQKNQRDESIRLLADWNYAGRKLNISSKLSYIRDYMHYRDTMALLNSKNSSNQIYAELGFNYRFNSHHRFLLSLPVIIAWVDSATVKSTNTQNRFAAAVNYLFSHFNDKLHIAFNIRGEVVDRNSFLLPGVNASYALTDWLQLKINAQRTYRVPTLNELYYNPGGNRNLKPEQGWSIDGGYAVNTRNTLRLVFNHELSVFNRMIDNWILWFGGAIWTPHNIATVHSRGVETDNKLAFNIKKWKLHIGVNTAYVLSTTVSSYIAGDGSISKQIPYSPRYNGQANIGFSYKALYVNYNHTYTGYRFITVDESQWLMPYNTGNVQLLYTLPFKAHSLQFTAQCNNIWNRQYQVVNARPMPAINWLFGLRLNIN